MCRWQWKSNGNGDGAVNAKLTNVVQSTECIEKRWLYGSSSNDLSWFESALNGNLSSPHSGRKRRRKNWNTNCVENALSLDNIYVCGFRLEIFFCAEIHISHELHRNAYKLHVIIQYTIHRCATEIAFFSFIQPEFFPFLSVYLSLPLLSNNFSVALISLVNRKNYSNHFSSHFDMFLLHFVLT